MKIVAFLILLIMIAQAQTEWKTDKKNPNRSESKHLIKQYDKFHDVTVLATKLDDVTAKVGNDRSAVSMSASVVTEKGGKPKEVFLAFSPETVSIAGSATAQAFNIKTKGKVFFRRGAEVILLVGNERIKLNLTEKAFPISGAGLPQEIFSMVVSKDTFDKMISAEKWELLIGDVIIDFTDRLAERVRPRLQALQKEIGF